MNVNDLNDARRGASPRARRGTRLVPAALLLLAPLVGACDGDNLFNGGAEDYVPVASVSAPDFASAGETISVRVDGYAARGVSQLAISMDGIVSQDTVITVTDSKTSVSHLVPVTVPVALQGTALRVRAHVIDKAGQFSPTAEAIVEAYGPPFVQILSAPVTVQPGQVVDIEVAATAVESVDQIALKLSGAVSKDTTVTVSPASQSVRQTIRFQVPALVDDTIMTVTATARDQAGNRGSASKNVPFVVSAPVAILAVPDTTWPGSRIEVEVQAQALRKVSEIKVELRGAVVKDTVVKFTPERTNVSEYVAIRLPGDISLPSEGTLPQIRVRAFAMDRSGVVTVTPVATIAVLLNRPVDEQQDEPVIRAVDVYGGSVVAGHFLDFRVTASGTRPIKAVHVRWTGLLPGELPDTTFYRMDIDPARLNIVEDVRVPSPCLTRDATPIMLVTVRDESDVLSLIWDEEVSVQANAACATPDSSSDSSSAAAVRISAAPSARAALPAPADFGATPAFLAGRGFALRSAGRKRRTARR